MRAVQFLTLLAPLAFVSLSIPANAAMKAAPTIITHTLKFGLSNTVCDRVRSAQQCFDFLVQEDEAKAPIFLKVSTSNSKEAVEDIEEVMTGRVSTTRERIRWEAIQELVGTARQVVTNLNDARSASVPEKVMPAPLKNLNAMRGVSRIEVVHRFLISGDRLLVDHQIIDRSEYRVSSPNPTANASLLNAIATAQARELSPDSISASFGKDIARSAKYMSENLVFASNSPKEKPVAPTRVAGTPSGK